MGGFSDQRVTNLFRRHQITPADVKYMIHSQQRTVLYLIDGREVTSSLPLKVIKANLSDKEFWSIQKGIVVAVRHTISIDYDCVYTMVDGRQFKGRSRNPAEHRRRAQMLNLPDKVDMSLMNQAPLSLMQQCKMMEKAPIAFCVIELMFSESGHGIDFIFRYCNREVEILEGIAVEDMIGRSFYDVFPDGDKKWIVPYADVALNGSSRILRDYRPALGRNITIRCFQPQAGYCACLLTSDDDK